LRHLLVLLRHLCVGTLHQLVDRILKEQLRDAQAAEQRLQAEQRALRGPPPVAKAWLKKLRNEHRFEDNFGLPF
jgi:hypothetical protein